MKAGKLLSVKKIEVRKRRRKGKKGRGGKKKQERWKEGKEEKGKERFQVKDVITIIKGRLPIETSRKKSLR